MKNYKNDIIQTIKGICKISEGRPLSTHLSIALSEYSNFDGISDKELYFILEKYKCEIELDHIIPHDEAIDRVIEEGTDFDKLVNDILNEDDEY